jgi:hypothetical protein
MTGTAVAFRALLILVVALILVGDTSSATLPVPGATQPSSLWGPLPDPSGGPWPERFRGTLRSVAEWSDLFTMQWGGERSTAEQLSRSEDSWDQYALAYDIDALTAIYLATGKAGYVDDALGLLENLVATARPSSDLPTGRYRDCYLGWVTQRQDVRGQQVPLYESYLWRYGVWLLRVVRRDPALWGDGTRRARYERLLAFAERDIFDKWRSRGTADTVYRSRAHLASHWAFIALGLAQITSDGARRRTYREVVQAINDHLPNWPSSLRGQLRMNPDHPTAYLWDDEWGRLQRPGQDVAHGNAVVAYVVAANSAGVDWNNLDMRGFTDAFQLVIWPAVPRQGQPEGAEYLDGSGRGNGWFSDGFVKLGRFSPLLQHRLEAHDVGRSSQFMANGALNAALLACRGAVPAAAPHGSPACRTG